MPVQSVETVYFEEKQINGISARTKNANEQDANTARIAPLWAQFYASFAEKVTEGIPVYAVYHAYEYDFNGEYTLTLGFANDVKDAKTGISIQAGRYLRFRLEGEMPAEVINGWITVWSYFSSPDCSYVRRYFTDFEIYHSAQQVDIYIAIQDT